MAEYNFPIPGAENEGEIVIFARRHWVSFLGQFFLSCILLVMPLIILLIIYLLGEISMFKGIINNFLVIILSVYYLIIITFAFIAWITFYYNVYIVTNLEIIEVVQTGFFGREISQLPLLRVQDVTSSIKGILPTYFSYGNVLIESASEQKEPFILCSVPNPQAIAAKIMALHDEVIEREGRHHQMLEGEGTLVADKKLVQTQEVEKVTPPERVEPKIDQPTEKTTYQGLLDKDVEQRAGENEGEFSKDDLDKGGEVDLK